MYRAAGWKQQLICHSLLSSRIEILGADGSTLRDYASARTLSKRDDRLTARQLQLVKICKCKEELHTHIYKEVTRNPALEVVEREKRSKEEVGEGSGPSDHNTFMAQRNTFVQRKPLLAI